MGMYEVLVALTALVVFFLICAVINYICYCFKLVSLSRKLKKLGGDIKIEYVRKFSEIVFGDKGKTNFWLRQKIKHTLLRCFLSL